MGHAGFFWAFLGFLFSHVSCVCNVCGSWVLGKPGEGHLEPCWVLLGLLGFAYLRCLLVLQCLAKIACTFYTGHVILHVNVWRHHFEHWSESVGCKAYNMFMTDDGVKNSAPCGFTLHVGA